eukprot:802487_1
MRLDEYIFRRGGNTVIQKLLIANNGIAAVKGMRSISRWTYEAFGSQKVIYFIVMATPEDLGANAEYLRMADEIIPVEGGSNRNNFANVHLITDVAERTGADGVWAGWGHASENPALPRALAKAGIAWVGPSPEAMLALGDKVASTLIAQSVGVSCMPWSGSGLEIDYKESSSIPDDVFRDACVFTVEEALISAERIGFPAMIKASEGGGGKGIRKVRSHREVESAFRQVQGEVPGSPIFIMKLATNCRHLEVQLLGDQQGQAIALFGRDCSLQRRHQKIIEEGPVPPGTCPPETWREMEMAAVRLCRTVNYVGAGTVEYLFNDDGSYCFLELNPRLQVEHPVTELISGVNLPAAQLQVAMGIPLHRIPEIRRMYGLGDGAEPIDFDNRERCQQVGHVIACRITAENPDSEFQPTSGAIHYLNFRAAPAVWGYFSVSSHSGVHEYADSQIGHIFAAGETREAARKNMVLALSDLVIRGEIRTTVEYLNRILESADFVQNRLSTTWMEDVFAKGLSVTMPADQVALSADQVALSADEMQDTVVVVLAGALHLARESAAERMGWYMDCLDRGRFLCTAADHDVLIHFDIELIYENVKYCLKVTRSGPETYIIAVNKWECQAAVSPLSGGGFLLSLDGKSHVVYGLNTAAGLRLILDGHTCLFTNEYDPSSLRTTMPGKLVRYVVSDGDHLEKGQNYAEVEVMKIYIPLVCPEAGRISKIAAPGSLLQAGDIVASLELDEIECVQKASDFAGTFPALSPPYRLGLKSLSLLSAALAELRSVLDGYSIGARRIQAAVAQTMKALRDPLLPAQEFTSVISRLSGCIPARLFTGFTDIVEKYAEDATVQRFYWEVPNTFSTFQIQNLIDETVKKMGGEEKDVLLDKLMPVSSLLHKYRGGNHTHVIALLKDLIQKYLDVEMLFNERRPEVVISCLRKTHRKDLDRVSSAALAHFRLPERNVLLVAVLSEIETSLAPIAEEFTPLLRKITRLLGPAYAPVVLKARKILMKKTSPSVRERRIHVESVLSTVVQVQDGLYVDVSPAERVSRLAPLINESQEMSNVLFGFFFSEAGARVQTAALEVYIRRTFRTFRIQNLLLHHGEHFIRGTWHYSRRIPSQNIEAIKSLRKDFKNNGRMSSTPSLYDLSRAETSVSRSPRRISKSPSKPQSGRFLIERHGAMYFFKDLDSLSEEFTSLLDTSFEAPQTPSISSKNFHRSLHVGVVWTSQMGALPEDAHFTSQFRMIVKLHEARFRELNINTICFIVAHGTDFPLYFVFRQKNDYEEDDIIRHIEPPMAAHLEISRLSNFNVRYIPTKDRAVHLFEAIPKDKSLYAKEPTGYDGRRFYSRVLIRQMDSLVHFNEQSQRGIQQSMDALPEPETALVAALNALETAVDDQFHMWRHNHIYMNCLIDVVIDVDYVKRLINYLTARYRDTLIRLNVGAVEVGLDIRASPHAPITPIRIFCSSLSRQVLQVETYVEQRDPESGGLVFRFLPDPDHFNSNHCGDLDGVPVLTPYPVITPFQMKREAAARVNTVYVYDFLDLFEHALSMIWYKHLSSFPNRDRIPRDSLLDVVELITQGDGAGTTLEETKRSIGQNDCGMVAWKLTLKTPEYPEGREIVLIANDITFAHGTFGLPEDTLYRLASQYARRARIPCLYISANSGARIGMAREILSCFKVAWSNVPSEGPLPIKRAVSDDSTSSRFQYLYVTEDDFRKFDLQKSIVFERIELPRGDSTAEVRYKILDIVGKDDGLNVENLSGSGMIAGECSRAYDEIFTLSYVTGRAVGIGAYLVRLGQRIVQKRDSPIILTGFNALNKVLGRTVYTSNIQLGGVDIMAPSGVSHLTVENDLEGVMACLRWLSFVPRQRSHCTPETAFASVDPPSRQVEVRPGKMSYDPRRFLRGVRDDLNVEKPWLGGFFDKDSWVETLSEWAKTVVTGRARLGGIPMGVLAVETRAREAIIPADPAAPESKEQILSQAGQVWYPDSAFKTAQSIRDFDRESLPLMIFANWRGFSGGMRDMFGEILKFGAQIVDALRSYSHPVFVYITPHGELRGGAWVVVDTSINADFMEMYASPNSRGGVLEPAGTCDVKFKKRQLLKLMRRLDSELAHLDESLKRKQEAVDCFDEMKELPIRESVESLDTPKDSQRSSRVSEMSGRRSVAMSLQKSEIVELRKFIADREEKLLPVYQQIVLTVADLHDTPGRMLKKRVIQRVVPWEESRHFFFWRMRRRIVECNLAKRLLKAKSSLTWAKAMDIVRETARESNISKDEEIHIWSTDRSFVEWVEKNTTRLDSVIENAQRSSITEKMTELLKSYPKGSMKAIADVLKTLSVDDPARSDFLKILSSESAN